MKSAVALAVVTFLCISGLSADFCSVESLVRKWAPKVWLQSDEEFFPISVSEYLTHVTPTLINCSTCSYPSDSLPMGSESNSYYLVANGDRDELLNDKTSFLYGHSPTTKSSSVEAFVTSCDSSSNRFIVTYWFFFPFDAGKTILNFSSTHWLKKFLEKKTVGSHVGDLERMSLEIKDGVPTSMFLSVHSIGIFYTYDTASNTFKYSHSTTTSSQKISNPPETVQVLENHPVIYGAQGSHGMWGAPGTYSYTEYEWISFLADEVNEGTAWDTWQDINVHHLNDTSFLPYWYGYLGYWGNPKGSCLTIPLFSVELCEYSGGPSSFASRTPDFFCG